jgi:tetratricopeptide (TPR) repeat protein
MKSERRHELHYNELGQYLTNLLAWVKKYANYLAWGALLVAVVVLVVVYMNRSAETKFSERQNDFEHAVAAADPDVRLNGLLKIAQGEGDKFLTAQATQLVAIEYSNRIISGQGKASKDELKKFSDQATQNYQRLIDSFKEYPAMVAQGHFGLGKLAENRGDFETAGAEFLAAKKSSPQDYPILLSADESIKELATLRQPVKFATTAPATQPASAATKPAEKVPATGATAPAEKPAK